MQLLTSSYSDCKKKLKKYSIKILTVFSTIMRLKDEEGMAASDGPDQTVPQEQSDLGPHCFLRTSCPDI